MKIKNIIWMIVVLAILALIPTGVLFCQNEKLKDQVAKYAGEQNINYKILSKSLQRAETKIAENSDELVVFADQNGINIQAVEEDLESLNGRLEAVAVTESKTFNVTHNHYPSDSNTPSEIEVPVCKEDGRPIDIHGYTKRIETRELIDSNGMRVADVSFSAAQKEPWSSKVYGIEYKINNTIGRSPAGKIILTTELLAQNPQAQPEQTFRIEGVDSRVLQAPPLPPTFDWWDPTVYLLATPGVEVYKAPEFSASLSLGFSIFSYGDDWNFLGISAGYDAFQNAFRASLFPFLYNVGGPLPFFQDLWIGLDVGLSHEANVSIGLIIGTRL